MSGNSGVDFLYSEAEMSCFTAFTCTLDDALDVIKPKLIGFVLLSLRSSSDKGPVLQLKRGTSIYFIAMGDKKASEELCKVLFTKQSGEPIPVYVADRDLDALKSRLANIGIYGVQLHSLWEAFYSIHGPGLKIGADPAAISKERNIYDDILTVMRNKYPKLDALYSQCSSQFSNSTAIPYSNICANVSLYSYIVIALNEIKNAGHSKEGDKKKQQSPVVKRENTEKTHTSPAGKLQNGKSGSDSRPANHKISVVLQDSSPKVSHGRTQKKGDDHAVSGSKNEAKSIEDLLNEATTDEKAKQAAKQLPCQKCLVVENNSNLDPTELYSMCINYGSNMSWVSKKYFFYGFSESATVDLSSYNSIFPDTNIFLV